MSGTGAVIAAASRRFELRRPEPGFVEMDPEDYVRRVFDCVAGLAASVPRGGGIRAVSAAAATGDTLLLDGRSMPLTAMVSWLDKRAVGRARSYYGGVNPEEIHRITGWYWTGGLFPVGHLSWWRRERPDLYGRAARVCMNNDYLTYRLTGSWGTDPSSATPSYLLDQVNRRWHRPFLDVLGLDEGRLSPLSETGTVLGRSTPEASRETGLPAGTPVVLGSFDHPSAARALGMIEEGDLLLSCGTSWVCFTPHRDRDLLISLGLLVDPFLTPAGPWGGMSSIAEIGILADQYVERFFPGGYLEFDGAAAEASAALSGFFIEPYVGSLANPGALEERCRGRTSGEIALAVMEGVAFRLRENIEGVRRGGIEAGRIAMVGGGASSEPWVRVVSDVTGLSVRVSRGVSAGAVGAALTAAVGIGCFSGIREGCGAFDAGYRTVSPDPAAHAAYDRVYESKRWKCGESHTR